MRVCNVCEGDYTGAYMRCQACGRLSRKNGMAVAAGIGMFVLWSRATIVASADRRYVPAGEHGYRAELANERTKFLPTRGLALRSLWINLFLKRELARFAKQVAHDELERKCNAIVEAVRAKVPPKSRFTIDKTMYHPVAEAGSSLTRLRLREEPPYKEALLCKPWVATLTVLHTDGEHPAVPADVVNRAFDHTTRSLVARDGARIGKRQVRVYRADMRRLRDRSPIPVRGYGRARHGRGTCARRSGWRSS